MDEVNEIKKQIFKEIEEQGIIIKGTSWKMLKKTWINSNYLKKQ